MLSFDHVSLIGSVQAIVGVGLRLTRPRVTIITPASTSTAPISSCARVSCRLLCGARAGSCARPIRAGSRRRWPLGVDASDPTPFHGADGTWSDISVGGGALAAAPP